MAILTPTRSTRLTRGSFAILITQAKGHISRMPLQGRRHQGALVRVQAHRVRPLAAAPFQSLEGVNSRSFRLAAPLTNQTIQDILDNG